MASTTKIMTAIVALENSKLDEDVVISGKAAYMGGSVIGLREGSTVKMKDLLYGMLICSGNDAAVAVAEHVGGSVEGFADLMNKKALEIGAYSTSFSNPHGLDAENHYTTAYDLAKITRYALKNSVFNEIVRSRDFYFNGMSLRSTNELLDFYEGADGVKTGYTGRAGRCLVASATRNNMRIISVVLFCDNRSLRTLSSQRILDFTFDEFGFVNLLSHGDKAGSVKVERSRTSQNIDAIVSQDLKAVLRNRQKDMLYTRVSLPESIMAPVTQGSILGTVSVFQGDRIIAETSLIALQSAEKMELIDYIEKVVYEWLKIVG
jgi:D-alanyl-D-alanine carboxypeptidase (penicillin-binding protein 5/6)